MKNTFYTRVNILKPKGTDGFYSITYLFRFQTVKVVSETVKLFEITYNDFDKRTRHDDTFKTLSRLALNKLDIASRVLSNIKNIEKTYEFVYFHLLF